MRGKILIVEDEKKLAEVMMLYLKNEGYEVKTANDGIMGEESIDQEDFDLIILDVMMPKKDGWSILRKIKNKGDTPVIMTTARGEEEDRIFGLELGAVDYMVKPISMKELIYYKSHTDIGDIILFYNNRFSTEYMKYTYIILSIIFLIALIISIPMVAIIERVLLNLL